MSVERFLKLPVWICLVAFLLLTRLQVVELLRGPTLKILNVTDTEIFIKWTALSSSVAVEKYQVSAHVLNSHSIDHLLINEWTFSNITTKAHLIKLHPGTQYNISVWAKTSNGNTDPSTEIVWTEVGEPKPLPPVSIIDRDGQSMKVHLHEGSSENGPITSYKVLVLEKSSIISFNRDQLYDFTQAREMKLPFYVTAKLNPEELTSPFIIGDQKVYGGYYNAPLVKDQPYEVIQEITSTLNGKTKSSYSPLESSVREHSMDQVNKNILQSSSTLSVILSAAIGVFGFLLVLSVIIYLLLRRRYGKRRPSDEMVLRVHGSDVEENGFIPGVIQVDEDTDLGDFYYRLKERYWQIPRNHLDVYQTVLGVGQFGEVREGVIHRKSQAISCLVQETQSPAALLGKEQRNLLLELESMTRIGYHPNVVEFIGACDEREMFHMVVEHHSTSLRGLLLRSRQQTGSHICNIPDMCLFEIALNISKGMVHLAENGILHHRLSSRSILVVDGIIPKVTNFGLAHFNPLSKKIDYTRWTAPESLRSAGYNTKSDVWSFGVLLWELFTLGGTPYVSVPTKEVPPRILRGMKLGQPKGISDELYQLILHCWELDPDERPTFHELACVLQSMVHNAKDHVKLEAYPGFQYEKFDPSADEQ